ncbi:MAG: hypothetical protein H0U74_14320 [Bradymonadaceae bacterium]|nr:hypothetical protein [Lujinxingiaceae bacterium]
MVDIEPFKLGFTFIPPHSTNYLPQRLDPFLIDAEEPLQIGLEASILVLGQLSFHEAAVPGPSGVAIFRRVNDEAGLYTQQVRVDAGRFEAFVLPGKYIVSLSPEEASIPGFVWHDAVFSSDTEFKRTLPAPPSALRVSGNISFKSLGLPGDPVINNVLVEEARVIAVSRTHGYSSTAGTTNEFGDFIVRVWPQTGPYALHITPSRPNSLIPEVIIEEAFNAKDHHILAPQTLGEYGELALALRVYLRTPSGLDGKDEGIDWSQTSVLLRARMGNGTLSLSAPVNAEGFIDVVALAGLYQIDVIPPLSSSLARTSLSLDLSPTSGLVEIEIPLKKHVTGVVLDHTGLPVDGVKVKLEPSNAQRRPSSEARTITVTTDADGQFEAWLEDSDYRLSAIPLANSGRPRAFLNVSTNEADFDSNLVVTLAEPVVVFGTLYDDALKGVANVTVQGFDLVDGQRRVLGEGQTNSYGEFRLVVPAP